MKFNIIIFSIGFATDIESAEPLSEVCTVRDMRPFVTVLIVVLAFVLCVGRHASGNSTLSDYSELASFSLQDFLCISFVVCTFVRHVHVDLFSLLLCAFLHADTCVVHVCFVDESLLFLQHLELHNFFCIKQYCYRLANMTGYYILQNRKMRASNIHKLCQKMYIFQIICWLQVDKQPYFSI